VISTLDHGHATTHRAHFESHPLPAELTMPLTLPTLPEADRADRNLFVVYEIWRDLAALKFHFDQPYVRQFVADASPMEAGDMSVQWLIMSSSLPHPLTGR
jgi:hypothetical protein